MQKEQTLSEKNKELGGVMKALEVYAKLLAERKDKTEEVEKLKAQNELLKNTLNNIKTVAYAVWLELEQRTATGER